MTWRAVIVGTIALGCAVPASAAAEGARMWQLWALNCQGCHRPDGSGSAGGAPPMLGVLGSFLRVPGGRAYLARVPGVATAPLSDAEVARLLNWTLYRFDAANVPPDFEPYSPAEVARLRRQPLHIGADAVRRSLLARMRSEGAGPRQAARQRN